MKIFARTPPSNLHSVKNIKVKQSLYRPLGHQEFEAPRVFRQWAHEVGKIVSPFVQI